MPNEDIKYPIPSNVGLFQDYDIVASLYPFVSVSICGLFAKKIYDLLYLFSELIIITTLGYSNSETLAIVGLDESDLLRIYSKLVNNNGYPELYSYLAGFFNNHRNWLHTGRIDEQIGELRLYIGTNKIITFYIPISREQLERSKWKEVWNYYFRRFDINDRKSKDGGLSVILFLNDSESNPFNFYVIPGCWTRQELINKIPDDVWNRLPRMKYRFTDGTEVIRRKAQP